MFGEQGAKRVFNLLGLAARKKPAVGVTPADVVHAENKWRLLRYRRPAHVGAPKFETPLLLVPSLINRHYVMDLVPGKSLAEWLVARGHDVFCIDWGTPGPEDRYLTFDDICDAYLGRALRVVAKMSPRKKAHVLGYCLGGTLAVIHAAARPEYVASLGLLAAPVSFKDDGPLAAWTQNPNFDPRAIVDAFGNAPWQLLQGAFNMLRPTLNLAKAVHLIDRAWNDEFLDSFLAIETWGNDNVSFPGAAFHSYIEELYRKDALASGEMRLSGLPAKMESIEAPVLCVTFEHDNIVPWKSASLLHDRVASKDKQHVNLPGGHVGAVVSKSAAKGLWPMLSDFYATRDHDVAHHVAREVARDAQTNGHAKSDANGHANGSSTHSSPHSNGHPIATPVTKAVTAAHAPSPEPAPREPALAIAKSLKKKPRALKSQKRAR